MFRPMHLRILIAALFLPIAASAEPFLVENGAPKAEIVIAEDAVPVIRVTAEFIKRTPAAKRFDSPWTTIHVFEV